MKKCTLLLIVLFSFVAARSTERLSFKISKPVCMLTFLQAANGNADMSQTLTEYIRTHIQAKDSAKFYGLVTAFSKLDLSGSYNFTAYPEGRQKPRTVLNLLTIAAVQSGSIKEFTERIVGILPNEQWLQLRNIFTDAEVYYDKMIGEPYGTEMKQQLEALGKFNDKAGNVFDQLKRFYGSTGSDDIPFTISIYAIPGASGHSTATPHSNSLVLSVFTKEQDHALRMGVAFHEISHVLYEEEPLALQRKIDDAFSQNTSVYSRIAYNYFDEALATVCGNGWAYYKLSGNMDKTTWYNDVYINGYAHALFAMVQDYMDKGKEIDKPFVDKAIDLFEKKFPDAAGNFQNILDKMHLYTDADDQLQNGSMVTTVRKYFRVSGMYSSFPITDDQSRDLIYKSSGSQLFIIHKDNAKSMQALAAIFPQLKGADAAKSGIICFYDEKKRPVVIINIPDIDSLDKALMKMVKAGKMKTDQPFIPLD